MRRNVWPIFSELASTPLRDCLLGAGHGVASGEQRQALLEEIGLPHHALLAAARLAGLGESVAPGRLEVAAQEGGEPERLAARALELLLGAVLLGAGEDRLEGVGVVARHREPDQMTVGGAEIGAHRERLLELGLGLVVAADQGQQLAQRIVGVGLVGRGVGVAAEGLLGGGELALRHVEVAEVVLGLEPVRIDVEQALIEARGRVPVLLVPGPLAGERETPGVARVALEIGVQKLLGARGVAASERDRVSDQEPLARREPVEAGGLQPVDELLARLLVVGVGEEQDAGGREVRIQLQRALEVVLGVGVVVAHARFQPGLEGGQSLGRARRPGAPAAHREHDDGRRGEHGERGADQDPGAFHDTASGSREMATNVMSS